MSPMQENENNNENLDTPLENDLGSQKVYEVGYLLLPTIPEENIPSVYGNLKELVSGLKGQAISDEMPTMINLAYTLEKIIQNVRNKYDTAYFGWMKFYLASDKVAELKKKLEQDSNIIRFLIIKTVKENTISAKRFNNHKDVSHRRNSIMKNNETERNVPINKEEIDKEIDAMVAGQGETEK
jgi:ribosomal protein S6